MGRKGTPVKFFMDRMKKYSHQVFKTSLLGERMAIFCRVSGNKFLFSNENKLVSVDWPSTAKKIFPYSGRTTAADNETAMRFRRVFNGAFNPNALQNYVGIVDVVAKEHLRSHGDVQTEVGVLSLIHWSPNTTHRNPEYFFEPEKFDPSRFEGLRRPIPYAYVPFERGSRVCPRKDIARLVVLVFVYNVVGKFRWETLIPNEEVVVLPVPLPAN